METLKEIFWSTNRKDAITMAVIFIAIGEFIL